MKGNRSFVHPKIDFNGLTFTHCRFEYSNNLANSGLLGECKWNIKMPLDILMKDIIFEVLSANRYKHKLNSKQSKRF